MSSTSESTTTASTGRVVSQAPLFVVLLALLGLLAPRQLGTPAGSGADLSANRLSAPAAKTSETSASDELKRMIDNLPGGTQGALRPIRVALWWGSVPLSLRLPFALFEAVQLIRLQPPQVLIATVHDPVDSHLQTYFDADFSVLQRAIQDDGLILSQHWLPWQQWIQQTQHPEQIPDSITRLYEKEPGVLLCHSESAAHPRILVVLLVGETPTGGVHAQAFQTALTIASRFGNTIRVVGPNTSGACFSICRNLTKWFDAQTGTLLGEINVHFISGKATSSDSLHQLDFSHVGIGSWLVSDVHTTILPDSIATEQMLQYLIKDRNIRPNQIALLRESGTSYSENALDSTARESDDIFRDVLILPYPMEIGTVRNEYEKTRELKFGPQQTTTAPRINLEVPWVEPPYARDHLPQFSDTTPAVTERRMSMMLSQLAHREIRAVGLLGTDPKDLLYLAQQMGRFCPNAQLFTFESNVLLTHPDYAGLFNGTIVASTYPSFLNNQEWCRLTPEKVTSQFANSLSEGVYNATLAHLEQINQRFLVASYVNRHWFGEHVPESPPLAEYSRPFELNTDDSPPLWLSVVGQNGLAPVRAISPEKDALMYRPIPRPSSNQPIQHDLGLPPFTLGSIIIDFIVFAFAVAFLLENLDLPQTEKLRTQCAPGIIDWLRIHPDTRSCSSSARWWSAYGLVLILALTAFQLVTNTFNRRTVWPDPLYHNGWAQSLAIVAFFVLMTCLFAMCRILSDWVPILKRRWACNLCWIPRLCVLLVLTALLTYTFRLSGNDLTKAIKLERWGRMVDGVSPLFPTACLTLIPFVWATCHLRRNYFAHIYHLEQPFCEQQTPGLAKRMQELNSKLTGAWWWPTEFREWVLIACIVWFGGSLCFRWINTADAPYFDLLCLVFGVLDVALIFFLYVRFMAACGLLERLLRRIAQTQLADSFAQIPPRLRSKAAGQVFATSPHPGDLDIVIRQLGALLPQLPFEAADLRWLYLKSQLWFRRLDCCDRAEKALVKTRMRRVNDALYVSCRIVIANLFSEGPVAAARSLAQRTPVDTEAWGRSNSITTPIEDSEESWKVEARKFAATQLSTLIRQAFTQIQNLLIFLTGSLLLLIFAVYSYPFQPRRYLSFCLIGLVVWIIAGIVVTFIRLNRNEVLSNLSNTTANRFTPDIALVRQLFVFGMIPLLSLLSFQFPELGNIVFFWAGGLQKAFQ